MSANRTKDLAKIHLAKKQLQMDDETYRAMLWTQARVESAAKLDSHGRKKVIEHLISIGAKFTSNKKHKRPANYNRLPNYITKVEALLADMDLPWSYADSIARNITGGKGDKDKAPGIQKLAWVKEEKHWRAIIAALHTEQKKRSLSERIDKQLEAIGKDEGYIIEIIDRCQFNSKNWRKSIKLMSMLTEYLETQYPEVFE